MSLKDDLTAEVSKIFKDDWAERDGNKVPSTGDIGLGNDAVKLDGTVLYADIADSTDLVNNHKRQFSSEIYKAFLRCATKIIKEEGGSITAYDGDRVMSVFIGEDRNAKAVRAALKIHYAVDNIIMP